MNIQEALLSSPSKQNISSIIHFIGTDVSFVKDLIDYSKSGNRSIEMRASWCLSCMAETKTIALSPFYSEFYDILIHTNSDSVLRNILKVMKFIKIPEKSEGNMLDLCFTLAHNKTKAIAVRSFAIHIAINLSKKYPELKNELKLLAHELNDTNSPAIKSVLRKISQL